MDWRTRRQSFVFTVYFLILATPFIIYGVSLWMKPVSCFDGQKNGDETGVDCGGGCSLRCEGSYKDLEVAFSRAFPTGGNYYDIFALLNNYNQDVAFNRVPYSMTIFNDNAGNIGVASGTISVGPYAKGVVHIPNVYIKQEPKFVDLKVGSYKGVYGQETEFHKNITTGAWHLSRGAGHTLQVLGEIKNGGVSEVFGVVVYALLYDETRTVYAVSRTEIDSIKPREEKDMIYTWGDIKDPQNVEFVLIKK